MDLLSNPNIPPPPKRKTTAPPKKRKPPQIKPNLGNPQDLSTAHPDTIPLYKAQDQDRLRRKNYLKNKGLISLPEARLRENNRKNRKMNNFTNDKINYNPYRSFPERVKDGAILANKLPPRKNKTRKKRDTSLKGLKNRPPGMGGRRKTRRKKRGKTRRKKRRKTRRKNKKSKRKTKRKR